MDDLQEHGNITLSPQNTLHVNIKSVVELGEQFVHVLY